MLRTVAECDKALTMLDMEREHVLKVRKFLEENGPQLFTSVKPKFKRDHILEIVLNNPGIDGRTVKETVEKEGVIVRGRQVQSALSNLAIAGEIENRGKHGQGARWYVKGWASDGA
jgi:hypothetical protein